MTRPCADVAAELRRIADDLDRVVGTKRLDVYLSCHVPWRLKLERDESADRALVDHVAAALNGSPAVADEASSGGSWQYSTSIDRGAVEVRAWCRIADPTERDKDAEIERLRQELAALRAHGDAAADTAGGAQ